MSAAGFALAFAVFASALLGSASAWSQSLSTPVVTFAATTDTTTEGGADIALRIGLPLIHIGSRVEIELTVLGTALAGPDYTLVAADSTQGITIDIGQNSTITLSVDSAPAELSLLLRPRTDDRISQGDRFLQLRISSYRVRSESGEETIVALPPAALDLTIRDDEAPTVQQLQVSERTLGRTRFVFACVLSNGGSVRCAGDNTDGQSTPPVDLPPVVQFDLGENFGCALTVGGEVRCWGRNTSGEATPPPDLDQVVQVAVDSNHSCALTVEGQVRCWGNPSNDQTTPPDELLRVAQLEVDYGRNCAVTVAGAVHCWGDQVGTDNNRRRLWPPADLPRVAQLVLGFDYMCAVMVAGGRVRCWGDSREDQLAVPAGLRSVVQIGAGSTHSCALTVSGQVHCWGNIFNNGMYVSSEPPDDLARVAQLSVGLHHACALTVSGRLRCWGDVVDISSLPPDLVVTAVDILGACALLAEGSLWCPNNPELIPLGLSAGEAVMSVWPRQLQPGQRAAIRFADLRDTTAAFTARIEVFGEGTADVSSTYRLLDSNGRPVEAEPDANSALLTGSPPMGWLEATGANRPSRLYVRPLELLSAASAAPSIDKVAQSVELVDGLFLRASTDTPIEEGEEAQLDIWLPLDAAARPLELELAVGGNALVGPDYTLAVANSTPGIVLGIGENSTFTLRVAAALTSPTEPLRLLLRTRADDSISQGDRLLQLRISRYQVVPETTETVDLPPALDLTIRDNEPPTVQQLYVNETLFGTLRFACVLSNGGSLRCAGDNTDGKATPPVELPPVVQIGVGREHSCALTVAGEVLCWGRNLNGQATPPADLGPVAQIGVGSAHSCALTVAGQLRCWGFAGAGRATPPDDLPRVAQLYVAENYSCVVTVSGQVRCWGDLISDLLRPPDDLSPVAQLVLRLDYSCAVMVARGRVRCWGANAEDQLKVPDGLGSVVQLDAGTTHSCALTANGQVHCWGNIFNNGMRLSSEPPDDLGAVVQLSVGRHHACALTVSGRLRCWGDVVDILSLPADLVVTAVDFYGFCALLADGSLVCPNNPELVPLELSAGEVVMSVWPQQLQPGQRAAIRFADLRDTTAAFTARIEVFGEGTADVSNYYRLLDSSGQPLEAEADANSGNSVLLTGNPPMAWLEATLAGRGSRLYVRPLELLPASGSTPSIRRVAQPVALVELSDRPFLTASIDTLTEGAEEAQLSIWLPPDHAGLRVELELLVSGTARAGADYTLVAAQGQQLVLGMGENSTFTLVVESAPTEPLRLLLRPRADDRLSQGDRLLNLRITRYEVAAEGGGAVDPPPALDFTIADDDLATVQQLQVRERAADNRRFVCVLMNGGALRCAGDNTDGQSTPPVDLPPVAQFGVGDTHACALTVEGELRCWGDNEFDKATPPDNLGQVAQLAVGQFHSCALTVAGEVRCWGFDGNGRATPPDELPRVAQLYVAYGKSCAVTVEGGARCWGNMVGTDDNRGRLWPPDALGPDGALGRVAQLALGFEHSCALTVGGRVHCWGNNTDGQAEPPDDLDAVVQLGVGIGHSCALMATGQVRCWGLDEDKQASPPAELSPVAQLSVGGRHSCALTVSGRLRCWGNAVDSAADLVVTAVDDLGVCAVLAEGSLVCPNNPEWVPSELSPGDAVMSVWPRQLQPGQRAAIRFAHLRDTTVVFSARIEVFGEGTADISSHYRLLSSDGQPLKAEPDANSGNSANSVILTGNPPMAWLEALAAGRGSRLYVRPLELLPAAGSTPSIRMVAQSVELVAELFLTASTDTSLEGGEEAQINIWLPLAHAGRQLELELAAGGNALAGADYTLVAAQGQQIVLGMGGNSTFTLQVASAPTSPTEPVRLLLRPRADDRISQGPRLLKLRINRYQVAAEGGGTVDLPPALNLIIGDDDPPAGQQLQVRESAIDNTRFACVLAHGGSLRCAGDHTDGRAMPPDDLGPVAQFGLGETHACALTVEGELRCWGDNEFDKATPPAGLGQVVQLAVGGSHSCALTISGEVRCWGSNLQFRSAPPEDLPAVAQLYVAYRKSCAVTVAGGVRCWGDSLPGQKMPPDDLGRVAQLALGFEHSCALTVAGPVRCWGDNSEGQAEPPDDLDSVVQLGAGSTHSCALTANGQVHCWGRNLNNGVRSSIEPPDDLASVAQLAVGHRHACALTVLGRLHCWGNAVAISSLPPDLVVTAVDVLGVCVLLAEGSVVCPNNPQLVPLELSPAEAVMSVWPRQLQPGQRAAIRFADLRDTAGAFSARIEVFGEGTADVSARNEVGVLVDVSSAYRLLDHNGRPLSAEPDGSYRLGRKPLPIAGEPPMGWLEATLAGRGSHLYVRPLELRRSPVPGSARVPSIRMVAQPVELVELSDRPFMTASADTLTEGNELVQLNIWLPPDHVGRRVEMELLVSGTALAGVDYILSAAPGRGIVLSGGEASDKTTLQVESASTPLGLRLRSRAADRISQGPRLLQLQISRYRVAAEGGGITDLPRVLELTILDDDPPTVQQVQVGGSLGNFACVLLNGGQLRCVGDNSRDRAMPDSGPDGTLGLVAQVSLSNNHGCAVTVFGEVRCWGLNGVGQASPPDDLGAAVQVGVNGNYSCGLAVAGEVRCWGFGVGTDDDRGDLWPPAELGPDGALGAVVQIGLGRSHVCALTASGEVRCWGNPGDNLTSPPDGLGPDGALGAVVQLAVGDLHNCVVTDLAQVHCWGSNEDGQSTPPDDLGAVVQLGVGDLHSCALTILGEVRCWGSDEDGSVVPPDDLGRVTQLAVGEEHSCALTVAGAMRCWGDVVDVSSLPPGAVTAVDFSGRCALLADGSLYCPNDLNLAPSELRPGAVVMSLWPRQLLPGQRAGIHFADRRETTKAFAVRIELLDGTAQLGTHYRLLNAAGQPLNAEADGSYMLAGEPQPATYVEALQGRLGQPLILHVLPLETVPADGSPPSIRAVAQRAELADVGRLSLRMHGGARRLLTTDSMVLVPLRLSLTDLDGGPLDGPSVLTVRLHGMLSGDAELVPARPFEITVSDTVAGTAAVMVNLGDSGETTLRFTVLDLPPGVAVALVSTALRVTLLSAPLDLDVNADSSVDAEDIILLMRFLSVGGASLSQRADAAEVLARLERLLPEGVQDLRLDLDDNGRMNIVDLRVMVRYLAGLRGLALGEGALQELVEALLQLNR